MMTNTCSPPCSWLNPDNGRMFICSAHCEWHGYVNTISVCILCQGVLWACTSALHVICYLWAGGCDVQGITLIRRAWPVHDNDMKIRPLLLAKLPLIWPRGGEGGGSNLVVNVVGLD